MKDAHIKYMSLWFTQLCRLMLMYKKLLLIIISSSSNNNKSTSTNNNNSYYYWYQYYYTAPTFISCSNGLQVSHTWNMYTKIHYSF